MLVRLDVGFLLLPTCLTLNVRYYSAKKIGALLSSNSASLKDASAKISLIGASRWPSCSPSLAVFAGADVPCVYCRAHFDKIISDLLMVKELSRHAGGGDFEGKQSSTLFHTIFNPLLRAVFLGVLEKCTAPMEALENRFADISRRVKRETAEVDALLDQYETTVCSYTL